MGEEKLSQPDPAVGALQFVEPLGCPFIKWIPGPIVLTLADAAGGNQMAEVVE